VWHAILSTALVNSDGAITFERRRVDYGSLAHPATTAREQVPRRPRAA
jgi:hypothetical protein